MWIYSILYLMLLVKNKQVKIGRVIYVCNYGESSYSVNIVYNCLLYIYNYLWKKLILSVKKYLMG